MKVAGSARQTDESNARILVATDNVSDAGLVKKLLSPEYEQVFVSTDPELVVQDFDNCSPDVLVLAFNSLEKSERYYLGLYRLSGKVHLQPHRTVILCNKDEVGRAYKACRKEYFDDYILFWPMTHDAPRLLMSVFHALRDLAAVRENLPSSAQFAAQARTLSEMGNMLDQKMAQGSAHIEVANLAMVKAEQEIGAALDGLSGSLAQADAGSSDKIQNIVRLEQEIKRLKQDKLGPSFKSVAASVQPMKQWADDFKKECVPHIAAARALNAMADCIPPVVLVVDDDDFQRKLVGEMLASRNYRLVFAAGGVEALNILRKTQPDVILMDIMMPELDGIETTRRLKAMPNLANVPVIMATGNSEGATVRDSMKAGAIDFVVKPFESDTMQAKVARALAR
ncbi:hypothetical protein BH11PSE11_BH11PSE11_11510 [soil metagenome]